MDGHGAGGRAPVDRATGAATGGVSVAGVARVDDLLLYLDNQVSNGYSSLPRGQSERFVDGEESTVKRTHSDPMAPESADVRLLELSRSRSTPLVLTEVVTSADTIEELLQEMASRWLRVDTVTSNPSDLASSAEPALRAAPFTEATKMLLPNAHSVKDESLPRADVPAKGDREFKASSSGPRMANLLPRLLDAARGLHAKMTRSPMSGRAPAVDASPSSSTPVLEQPHPTDDSEVAELASTLTGIPERNPAAKQTSSISGHVTLETRFDTSSTEKSPMVSSPAQRSRHRYLPTDDAARDSDENDARVAPTATPSGVVELPRSRAGFAILGSRGRDQQNSPMPASPRSEINAVPDPSVSSNYQKPTDVLPNRDDDSPHENWNPPQIEANECEILESEICEPKIPEPAEFGSGTPATGSSGTERRRLFSLPQRPRTPADTGSAVYSEQAPPRQRTQEPSPSRSSDLELAGWVGLILGLAGIVLLVVIAPSWM